MGHVTKIGNSKRLSSRWRHSPFWIPFIAHDSLAIAYIRTTFSTWIHFMVLRSEIP